ncbi:hypothetical protein NQ317_008156 [Molorchus minor]|uniref:JmjC domain-containing protein n=1 Tax=Molorchus minor TaxID=1323400 RepID=A0ABQ9JK29_9CUCU|nr:hypothetical protein NQ317_008156 [Molorchus minor]
METSFISLSNFRKIVLNPGEVLYLPHKWWHYVEHLETAISINVWIPSPDDDRERLKESIVQLLVKQMTNVSDDETNRCILNPNMEEIVLNSDFNSILKTMSFCKNVGKDKLKIEEKTEGVVNVRI